MRNGTPIERSLKAVRTTTHYIWRTRLDDKVRPSHAANDGKVFSWDSPPSTGHPGDDYNCRCWADPVPNADPIPATKIRNEYLIAGPFGIWGPSVEIFSLGDSEQGRGADGFTVTHNIETEFNFRGDGPISTFDVEITGLGQTHWVTGPGSTTIEHSYELPGRSELRELPTNPFNGTLSARARSHGFTLNIDARVTFK